MTNYRTSIIKLYPTINQKYLINLTFALCSNMYNEILTNQIAIYQKYLKEKSDKTLTKNFFKNNKRDTVCAIKKRNKNYYNVDSLALEYEEKNVFMAFKMFFRKKCRYPKFKNIKDQHSYITRKVKNNICIENNYIRLPKLGFVKFRGLNAKFKDMTITIVKVYEDKTGNYYAHITFKEQVSDLKPIDTNPKNTVGLDFKIGTIFVSSDNTSPKYDSPYYKRLYHLKQLEKSLAKKQFDSNNRLKTVNKIRRIHKKIKNTRHDLLHKVSTYLSNSYTNISIESLNLQDISKKLHNGTNTYDTSYSKFVKLLSYKTSGHLIKIDKWFPSTKTCCICGYKRKHMKLNTKIYYCNNCGNIIDRDLNAAINIKNEGLKILNELK